MQFWVCKVGRLLELRIKSWHERPYKFLFSNLLQINNIHHVLNGLINKRVIFKNMFCNSGLANSKKNLFDKK